jgi:hypothetical protein
MAKASSALFIPLAESLFLVLVFYFAASAAMDQTMKSDFSPAMRSMLFSQLILIVATIAVHLVVAIADKSQFVLPDASVGEGGDDFQQNLTRDEYMDAHLKRMRNDLKSLISQRVDFR